MGMNWVEQNLVCEYTENDVNDLCDCTWGKQHTGYPSAVLTCLVLKLLSFSFLITIHSL